MACPDFNEFTRWILAIDQKVAIDKMKDKPLRYNVWETTSKEVSELTGQLSTEVLSEPNQSLRIVGKINNTLKRIRNSSATGGNFQTEIMDHEFNKEMSIALHEMMESVKGESDKARNKGIQITEISNTGVLPALPLSRIAASIGRKIAFQKGYRFKRPTNAGSAAKIEAMYYDIGHEALVQLEKQGYVTLDKDVPTIMDYQNREDLKKDFPNNDKTRSDVLSVSLDEAKLKIKPNTEQSAYFLKRTSSNLDNTNLGVITDKLNVANQILQPATVILPDTKVEKDADLGQWDDGVANPDPKTEEARKNIYEKAVKVAKPLQGLMELFNKESEKTGQTASKTLAEIFGTRTRMVNSLFGLKKSDDYSIDKKESIGGQNLSKTTPVDDLAEYFGEVGNKPLHMRMKIGRNARLYYLNSVLNAHGSKHSRYMLTPGEYTIDVGSADFAFLVWSINESLGNTIRVGKKDVPITYQDILKGPLLKSALEKYDTYLEADTLKGKLFALGNLAREFPGVNYVSILTSLQAVKDVRGPKGGTVTTEFPVSSDATASGGSLTFLQALGTNPKVKEFLQRIGVLKPDGLVENDLDDIYGLMTEAIDDFINDKPGSGLGADLGDEDVKGLLQDTLDMLYIKSEETKNKDVREFSKDPTMTFVYGQGRNGAVETLSRSLADRIIDNLDDPKTREYLSTLFNDKKYNALEGKALRDTEDLYQDIVDRLKETDLPGNIYDIMDSSIRGEYLKEYTARAQEVYDIVKLLPADLFFKILPAGAVLAGKKASNPEDLKMYGMPITKKVEVLNTFPGIDDTVLTRVEKLQKTVMDVSTIHGTDAALLYHSLADVDPSDGVVVVHDEIRGSVPTVRKTESTYVKTAKDMAMKYDVHQQIMEAVATASPEIANSAEFKSLKARIDKDVAAKQKLLTELFNDETDALIGDGKAFEEYAKGTPEAEPEADTGVQLDPDGVLFANAPTVKKVGTPLAEQDFGDTFVTLTEGSTSVEVLAQEYWNDIQSRLAMVDQLRTCLAK